MAVVTGGRARARVDECVVEAWVFGIRVLRYWARLAG